MINLKDVILILITGIAAPLAGGLAAGAENLLTSLLTGRKPHSVLRPFADFAWGIKRKAAGRVYFLVAQLLQLLLTLAATALLVMRDDVLLAMIMYLLGNLIRIAAGASLNSPYARLGAQYETVKFFLYASVIVLTAICIKLVSGSFILTSVIDPGAPLLSRLPLVFVVYAFTIPIKLGKSPFNFSKLAEIETTGKNAALNMPAGWIDRVFLYGLLFILSAGNYVTAAVITVCVALIHVLCDVFFPDFKPYFMLKWGSFVALLLIGINMLWIFLGGVIK